MDMTAGADAFASGLFTRFDLTCLVAEPTRKSVSVYQQYREYAEDYDVTIRVVGNKVTGPEDVAYLREHTGADLVACLGASHYVRAQEQGRDKGFDTLEPANRTALARLQQAVDAVPAGLGQIHPAGGPLPPEERSSLGRPRDRGGPRRAGRPGLRHGTGSVRGTELNAVTFRTTSGSVRIREWPRLVQMSSSARPQLRQPFAAGHRDLAIAEVVDDQQRWQPGQVFGPHALRDVEPVHRRSYAFLQNPEEARTYALSEAEHLREPVGEPDRVAHRRHHS